MKGKGQFRKAIGLLAALGCVFVFSACVNSAMDDEFEWDDIVGGFVRVTGISGLPARADPGTNLTLTGTATPFNATNRNPIIWSVDSPGTTGAVMISANVVSLPTAGVAQMRATITNGAAADADFELIFSITVAAGDDNGNGGFQPNPPDGPPRPNPPTESDLDDYTINLAQFNAIKDAGGAGDFEWRIIERFVGPVLDMRWLDRTHADFIAIIQHIETAFGITIDRTDAPDYNGQFLAIGVINGAEVFLEFLTVAFEPGGAGTGVIPANTVRLTLDPCTD